MTIKILNDKTIMSVKSKHKLSTLQEVGKLAPEELKIRDDAGEVLYEAMIAKTGCGSINNIGVEFAPETGEDGLAKVTVCLPACEDVKRYVADNYGRSLDMLRHLDEQIDAALAAIAQKRTAICNLITIVD